jgi:catechol 2,3-dioxygenase-like lactoylglutathione lyase family enzyme
MTIEALHHVSLAVTNLQRSEQFYATVLGLRKLPRPAFDFPGAWFAVGALQQLHLIVHPNQTFRTGKGLDTRDTHLAVRVASYQDTLQYLRSHGYREDSTDEFQRIILQPHARAGFPQMYILDPDRNVIEINAAALD